MTGDLDVVPIATVASISADIEVFCMLCQEFISSLSVAGSCSIHHIFTCRSHDQLPHLSMLSDWLSPNITFVPGHRMNRFMDGKHCSFYQPCHAFLLPTVINWHTRCRGAKVQSCPRKSGARDRRIGGQLCHLMSKYTMKLATVRQCEPNDQVWFESSWTCSRIKTAMCCLNTPL